MRCITATGCEENYMSPLGIFIDFVFLENNSKHNMINQIQDSGKSHCLVVWEGGCDLEGRT